MHLKKIWLRIKTACFDKPQYSLSVFFFLTCFDSENTTECLHAEQTTIRGKRNEQERSFCEVRGK